MTRVLIVEDDPVQLKSLARLIALRQPDMHVETASDGAQAIDVLSVAAVDVVLTDLQMPSMNGLDLIAWLVSHQPHVPVFTMTAYPDSESARRLYELGNIECFTKPLDVPGVLERVSDVMTQGVRGHVQNLSLAALLQIIEMEQKTCTLVVEATGGVGQLYIRQGALVHARCGDVAGELAAFAILGWSSPSITIMGTCATVEHTVASPLSFVIMEALRLKDEMAREDEGDPFDLALEGYDEAHADAVGAEPGAVDPEAVDPEVVDPEAVDPEVVDPEAAPSGSGDEVVRSHGLRLPTKAEALALVRVESGEVVTSIGEYAGLDGIAKFGAAIYRAKCITIAQQSGRDQIEEIVVTAADCWVLLMPTAEPDVVAMLVFSPKRVNLAMVRHELTAQLSALVFPVEQGAAGGP